MGTAFDISRLTMTAKEGVLITPAGKELPIVGFSCGYFVNEIPMAEVLIKHQTQDYEDYNEIYSELNKLEPYDEITIKYKVVGGRLGGGEEIEDEEKEVFKGLYMSYGPQVSDPGEIVAVWVAHPLYALDSIPVIRDNFSPRGIDDFSFKVYEKSLVPYFKSGKLGDSKKIWSDVIKPMLEKSIDMQLYEESSKEAEAAKSALGLLGEDYSEFKINNYEIVTDIQRFLTNSMRIVSS